MVVYHSKILVFSFCFLAFLPTRQFALAVGVVIILPGEYYIDKVYEDINTDYGSS